MALCLLFNQTYHAYLKTGSFNHMEFFDPFRNLVSGFIDDVTQEPWLMQVQS